MMILYQFEISPFCDKARRALRYKGWDFRIEEIPPSHAASGRWRSISPTGKLPLLEHDGKGIVDSTDILHYREEITPTPPLFPAVPAQRAQAHVLEDWADESLHFYELTMRTTWPHNALRWIPELLAAEKPLTRHLLTPVLKRIGKITCLFPTCLKHAQRFSNGQRRVPPIHSDKSHAASGRLPTSPRADQEGGYPLVKGSPSPSQRSTADS